MMRLEDFRRDAHADAHAPLLFGKEKVGVMGKRGLGKAGAGIAKDESHGAIFLTADGDRAAAGHGLDGVERDIADRLRETAGIDPCAEAGGHFIDEAHPGVLGLRGERADDTGDDLAQVRGSNLRRLRAGEEHPLLDQSLDLRGFAEEHGERVVRSIREVAIVRGADELRVHADGRERIANLVGEAGGHAAEQGETLGLLPAGALLRELGAGGEIGTRELTDFVLPLRAGQRATGIMLDVWQALGEQAQRAHETAGQHPGQCHGENPKCDEQRQRLRAHEE